MTSVKSPSWQQNSAPLATFTPCSNSHPFDERRIPVTRSEESAVKIGRAVVRLQPAQNNAIFDCKVLSRNHAIMWYEDGQFLIKDTRSSNGTFVNNERLSNSGEESGPRVLRSGDILQLGVEIVDNAKKVASGCVTCIVTLINEKGEECGDAGSSGSVSQMAADHPSNLANKYTLVRNDKLFVMDQYLLGQKLQMLEEQLATSQEALENSWQALINEEQLLSRIELLESQLALVGTRNTNNEEVRKEIQHIHEDRAKAELSAKDSLRKAEEQVYETSMKLHDAENGLINIEEENQFLRSRINQYEDELAKQRAEHEELNRKFSELLSEQCKKSIEVQKDSSSQESSKETNNIDHSISSTSTEFTVSKVPEDEHMESRVDQLSYAVEQKIRHNTKIQDGYNESNDEKRSLIMYTDQEEKTKQELISRLVDSLQKMEQNEAYATIEEIFSNFRRKPELLSVGTATDEEWTASYELNTSIKDDWRKKEQLWVCGKEQVLIQDKAKEITSFQVWLVV
ncbi:FHA domain-containing protein [Ditylenchus destructor]|uniref:FHA domain-containing protein n=1 Tax=Ditylenchus destructor TaxID=166010 RepID=A0AAD4N8X8_9BILA|nr:FHA domain-containing protein [Ditylenchus destructor]